MSPPYLRLRQVASNRHLLFVWFGDLGEGKPRGALRLPALSLSCTLADLHSRRLALSQSYTLAGLLSRSLAAF